jgi:cold shock CspA family protein
LLTLKIRHVAAGRTPDGGGKDVFVNIVPNRGKESAENLG